LLSSRQVPTLKDPCCHATPRGERDGLQVLQCGTTGTSVAGQRRPHGVDRMGGPQQDLRSSSFHAVTTLANHDLTSPALANNAPTSDAPADHAPASLGPGKARLHRPGPGGLGHRRPGPRRRDPSTAAPNQPNIHKPCPLRLGSAPPRRHDARPRWRRPRALIPLRRRHIGPGARQLILRPPRPRKPRPSQPSRRRPCLYPSRGLQIRTRKARARQ